MGEGAAEMEKLRRSKCRSRETGILNKKESGSKMSCKGYVTVRLCRFWYTMIYDILGRQSRI